MEFLRDPIWQSIGVIITILLPIIFYIFQRNRKEITYEIVSNTPVISIEKEIKNKMQVVFNNKPVNDAHLMIIRLWNSGNQAIRTEDFDQNRPIAFNFSKDIEVIDSEILETIPLAIKSQAKIKYTNSDISLEPLLLNKKDSITFKLLLSGSDNDFTVVGRILDVKDIKDSKTIKMLKERITYAFSLIYVIIVFPAYFIYYVNSVTNVENLKNIVYLLVILVVVIFMMWVSRSKRYLFRLFRNKSTKKNSVYQQ